MKRTQTGFALLEGLLILVIIALIGGTGWYVVSSRAAINESYDNTSKNSFTTSASKKVVSSGSGLEIKEWGVKIPVTDNSAKFYYKISDYQEADQGITNIDIYSKKADAIKGPSGKTCEGEYIAFVMRAKENDQIWSSEDPGVAITLFGERKTIGDYRYAVATKKQYSPQCFSDGTGNNEDESTARAFREIVDQFKSDFTNIQAI